VPRVKQAPGFVAAYWVRIEGGDKGRSTIVFESEDATRAAAEQISQQTQANEGVTVDSVEIGEVVESAY
jgi:heme-degrading monooxygenase HmoA